LSRPPLFDYGGGDCLMRFRLGVLSCLPLFDLVPGEAELTGFAPVVLAKKSCSW
jgi:hypothetical protein